MHFNRFWELGDKAHILNHEASGHSVGPGEMLKAERREERGGVVGRREERRRAGLQPVLNPPPSRVGAAQPLARGKKLSGDKAYFGD